ncbi:RHS repeat-associated core domain-containing protein [uncultured Psychroserpens sp.]|uniref:RHS repeat-associated core domain-containing protein n=1 Tax=uncultured Psychroserpens sp. TaxID=255436 RepID=UPI00261FC9AF|nr:RHS repeat-associated core domain-containing protein [uncultured Psychroserpens sp.]
MAYSQGTIVLPPELEGIEIVEDAELYIIDSEIGEPDLVSVNPNTYLQLEVDNDQPPFFWFKYTVNVLINPILADGTYGTSYTRKLSVEYNPNGNSANFIDLKLHKLSGRHGAYVKVISVLTEDVENSTTSSITPDNVKLSLSFNVKRFYQLSDSLISLGIDEVLDDGNPCTLEINWSPVLGAEEYELEWTWIDNYGDTTSELPIETIDLTERDFELNNTRVQISDPYNEPLLDAQNLKYQIPLIYARGYLVFRIRAVGRFLDDVTIPFYGNWSTDGGIEETKVSHWEYRYHIEESHENNKNWQFQSNYAEDGKKKEVISYFDGTLRNRQTVTTINSNDNAIVGEVIYDNQGRPAIEVLPVPSGKNKLQYFDTFNRNENDELYTHLDFDWDNVLSDEDCDINLIGMSPNISGASKYYSPNNDTQNNFQDYVPDAKKFPFSQIEYTPDNSGRIRRKSGVGIDHRLDTGNETTYFYSQPTSSFELNRLFGYEVGDLTHYKKNAIIDPNGQISVNYLNPQGRTIATALAGSNPLDDNENPIFQALEDETNAELHDFISADLMQNNVIYSTGRYELLEDGSRIDGQGVVLQNNSNRTFNYTLINTEEFTFLECPQTFPYEYDLTMALFDDCGVIARGSPTRISETYTFFQERTMNIGEYGYVKDLIVSEEALEEHWNTFITTATQDGSECILTQEDFALIMFDCSTIDCDIIAQGVTSYIVSKLEISYNPDDYNVVGDTITVTTTDENLAAEMEAFILGLEESFPIVTEFCEQKSLCFVNEQTLLADMSPHGQYGGITFDFEDLNGNGELDGEEVTLPTISTPLSIFNDGSGGIPNLLYYNNPAGPTIENNDWRHPLPLHYINSDGTLAKIEVEYLGLDDEGLPLYNPQILEGVVPMDNEEEQILEIYPEQLAYVSDFIAAWNPNWAKALLPYHPEYCYLEYTSDMCDLTNVPQGGLNTLNTYEYDDYLRSILTYSDAQFDGLIGSGFIQIMEKDPFFYNQYASETASVTDFAALRRAIMEEALTNNFNGFADDFPPNEICGILSYSYAVVKFGSLMNEGNILSIPDTAVELYSASVIGDLTPEEKDNLWTQYVNNYLGLKAKIYDVSIAIHATNSGCFNDCLNGEIIGQDVIDLADDYDITISSGSGPFTDLISSYLDVPFNTSTIEETIDNVINPPAVTLCTSSSAELYNEKVRRFPFSTYLYDANILNDDPNIIFDGSEDEYYELTGKCKSQLDLEIFLRGFFKERNELELPLTTNLLYDNTYFIIDLFEEFGGVNGEEPSIKGQILGDNLIISFEGIANDKCTDPIVLSIPTGSGLSWSGYGSTWEFDNVIGITELYYDPLIEEENRYHYEILGTVKIGGQTVEYVFKGNTCAQLNSCLESCNDLCDRQFTIGAKADLAILLNRILNDNDLNSSILVDIGGYTEYTSSFLPAFYNVPFTSQYNYDTEGNFNFTFNNGTDAGLIFRMDGTYDNANTFIQEFLDVRFESETSINGNPAHNITLVYLSTSDNIVEDTGILEYENHSLLEVCLQDPEYFLKFTLRKQISQFGPNGNLFFKDVEFSVPTKTYALHELMNFDFNISFDPGVYTDPVAFGDVNLDLSNSNLSILLNGETYNYGSSDLLVNFSSREEGDNKVYHCFDPDALIKRDALQNDLSWAGQYPAEFSISLLDYSVNGNQALFNFNEGMGSPTSSDNSITMSSGNPWNWVPSFDDLDAVALAIQDSPYFPCDQINPTWTDDFEMIFESGLDLNFKSNIRLNSQLHIVQDDPLPGDNYYFGHIAQLNYFEETDNNTLYSLIVSAQTSIDYETQQTEECPCVVQTVKPVSSDEKWNRFYTYFGFEEVTYNNGPGDDPATYTVTESTVNVLGIQLPDLFTKAFFCGMNYQYITETYIHYLEELGVDSVSHPFYLTIGSFGNTDLNYGFDDPYTLENEMELVIEAYALTGLDADGYPLISWSDFVRDYIMENDPCIPAPMIPEVLIEIETPPSTCDEIIESITQAYAQDSYLQYLEQLRADFEEQYINGAIANAQETFTVIYPDKEYQYTLYYYDQAGNLTQTVSPEGVQRLGDDLDLAEKEALNNQINQDRETGSTTTALPDHDLNTAYRYNSLNQLIWQKTPDGGETQYAYDALGRIIASQNANQAAKSDGYMSYTEYDDLGRIVEAGEIIFNNNYNVGPIYFISDNGQLILSQNGFAGIDNQPVNGFDDYIKKQEITITIYDEMPGNKSELFEDYGNNDRNRVTAILYLDTENSFVEPISPYFDNAIFYDYDIHGNVKEMITEINKRQLEKWNHHIKKVHYEYDLISGNVNQVIYQRNKIDQFMHRYEYDADNRIVMAQTSNDGEIWETDAQYEYYEHGPLARVLLGDKKVQAMDYVYTLQGWIKGVNGEKLDLESGMSLSTTAKDAYAYALSYFNDDYKPRTSVANPFTSSETHYASNSSLMNGNIRGMTTALMDTDENPLRVAFNTYSYDQLNRIVGMSNYEGDVLGGTPSVSGINTTYAYDRNGNLDRLYRSAKANDGTIKDMDVLTYEYYDISGNRSNRLKKVNDDVADNVFEKVDIDNHKFNYRYDKIGQLVQDYDEGIKSINWRADGKVESIDKTDGDVISFTYDGLGNRQSKTVESEKKITYYIRDAQGNVMSVYNKTSSRSAPFVLKEQHLFGSSRLGIQEPNKTLVGLSGGLDNIGEKHLEYDRLIGDKRYELSNHLGNVLSVINDKKLPKLTTTGIFDYFVPDEIAFNDYYPFGSLIPSRRSSTDLYRYGFGGVEMDDEIKGEGNSLSYTFRHYDPRVGRFFATDPLTKEFPWYSPYLFAGNTPIMAGESEGLYPIVRGGKIVGYVIEPGQGPTQISEDINNPETQKIWGYTLQKPVTWDKVVMDNVVYYAKAGGLDNWKDSNMLDIDNPIYRSLNSNAGEILEINLISADSEETLPPIPIQEDDRYGGAGLFEYSDEILAGANKYTSGLKNGGGYIAYSKAKTGKGLYWKPNARGLNNINGGAVNVNKVFKFGGPILGTALEVPEIIDGYEQNSHEGNKQVAGAVGSVGGGWLGGAIAGAGMGLLGIETGPGVVITVIAGAIIGGFVGEEGMERMYDEIMNSEPREKQPHQYITTCFVAGTKIEMADGSFKNIEDVVAGDKILSIDVNTMKLESDLVVEIPQKVKKYKRIKIVMADNTTIECSPAHPIWVEGKGWSVFSRKEAKKELTFNVNVLEENDIILKNVNGKLVELKISTITDTGEFVEMYNVEFVKKNNTFFANGVLVHNKRGAIND